MKYLLLIVFIVIILLFRNYIVRHIFTPIRKENKKVPNIPYENVEIEMNNGKIRGWLMKSEGAKGSFILVHGWSSNKSDMLRYAEPLVVNGYDVLLVDVLGHGQSDATEKQVSIKSFVQSIKMMINYVEKRPDVHKEIYVLGHSLGGTAASIVNGTEGRIQALITDSMPTSLKSISKSMAGNVKMPYIPFGWLFVSWFLSRAGVFFKTRREWRLEKILKNQKSPALAIHSIHDKIVPISNVDILLMDSNFKQVIKVGTKGHNNCVKDEHFWEYVFHFITSNAVVDEAS